MDESLQEHVKVEPCAKRVRAYLRGQLIADTIRSKLVWEVPHYPAYYIPVADVRMELLTPGARTERSSSRGEAQYFSVKAGDRLIADAAWHYPESPIHQLREHVRFRWDAMEAWFEEEEEVFVHPHDPNKRIDTLHASRHIEVSLKGVKIADTHRPTLVYETGAPIRYYVPKSDVRMDLLTPTDKRTGCAYKGFARYWNIEVGDEIHKELAWSYPTPFAELAKITGLVAFYNEGVDITIDDVRQERP